MITVFDNYIERTRPNRFIDPMKYNIIIYTSILAYSLCNIIYNNIAINVIVIEIVCDDVMFQTIVSQIINIMIVSGSLVFILQQCHIIHGVYCVSCMENEENSVARPVYPYYKKAIVNVIILYIYLYS